MKQNMQALRTQNGAQCSIKCQVKLRADESRVGGKLSKRVRPRFLPATFATSQIFISQLSKARRVLVSQEHEPENLDSGSLCDAIARC